MGINLKGLFEKYCTQYDNKNLFIRSSIAIG